MSDIVLKVENLYKRYRLGNVDRTAFKEDIISFIAKLQGKPDPYESYITSNELAAVKDINEVKSRYVWSLQDINFEVKRGEILGIIGKNGAGKSTLLKILSKTTAPTKGNVKIKGRIASLLEVGTGFHPELTGRENIYMNGAILGMHRYEITQKLDEIIDFAGVEAFIDTPVKRYSSGMYVRLAFAVAAHLEPDILIIDEVLAVGDAEFQKKCIGKMKDVSTGEGRTVLFVSHNIDIIKRLCNSAILLKNGKTAIMDNVQKVLDAYSVNEANKMAVFEQQSDTTKFVNLRKASVLDMNKKNNHYIVYNEPWYLQIEYEVNKSIKGCLVWFAIYTLEDLLIFTSCDYDLEYSHLSMKKVGYYKYLIDLTQIKMNKGNYKVVVGINTEPPNVISFDRTEDIGIEIVDDGKIYESNEILSRGGIIKPLLKWQEC
jgi:lipopolysaccharide transport system ATP-binding protein